MKDKANKGWIKELASKPKATETKKPYTYSKPVVQPPKPNSMAFNHRAKEHKSVKQDKTTNFAVEQSSALKTHKGK